MEEKLVNSKTAKLAKSLGFKLPVYACYNEEGVLEDLDNLWHRGCEGGMELYEWFHDYNSYVGKLLFSAPTQSLLQRWLREVHKIDCEAYLHNWTGTKFERRYKYHRHKGVNYYNCVTSTSEYITYEDALEEGLYETLVSISNLLHNPQ